MWKNKNGETGSGLAFALPDDEVIRFRQECCKG